VAGVVSPLALWIANPAVRRWLGVAVCGHIAERKPPEFFKDWRHLFVGLQWWWAKLRGQV
jgi:hypothetical protein